MTVVVTGAAGHVGGNLVRALLEQKRQVRVLVHEDTRALDGLDAERVDGNVLDQPSLEVAFSGADVVYHLAAVISIQGSDAERVWRVNVEGTQNVLAACRACGVRRLVYFSSIHALAPEPKDEMIDESRTLTDSAYPLAYDRSKGQALRLVRKAIAAGLDAVVLNPTGIIGPFDFKPSHMGQVLLDLYHGRLPALVAGGFDWVDVRDVVAGAMAAEVRAPSGGQYLLSGTWRSIEDIAELVRRITGRDVPSFVTPMWLARVGAPFMGTWARIRGRRPLYTADSLRALRNHSHVSHARASAELGYAPRPTRVTIEDSLQWFEKQDHMTSTPGGTA